MDLEQQVKAELLAIRKSSEGLTPATVARSPVIRGLLGAGDPQVAYNTLKHLILNADSDTGLEAATSSLGLTSDKLTHLGRLDEFGDAHGYEQRHVRRYSDKGIQQLAALIATSWTVNTVPFLDLTVYQVGPDRFVVGIETKCQHYIEMRPVQVHLYQGSTPPRTLNVDFVSAEEDIWNLTKLARPIEIHANEETSLTIVWRGELWPKFAVFLRTDISNFGIATETLANKLMIRMLPSH
ncbi:hypothetical protein [Nocardia gamkensis]|uniref:Uncharacterized protein n=1 Tax=Nocardia gamkensis TaxID=352869 RepID=A0A7X6L4N7_9NOCA|nr:hypothetical protein [Nocardia gamkensis]NKY27735.1 hypothetical protein [Nocardia gamkensis]NQE67372.1 hypothetical protein [Nocardia gamkensis]